MMYEELTVSVTANQDDELRTVIGLLVQDLDDQYVLVEREDGKLGVLNASDLAWLSYSEGLEDLERYFLPAYQLDGAGLTEDEIDEQVCAHADGVVLLYDGDEFQKLIIAPPLLLDDGVDRSCRRVKCKNCKREVVLCDNRRKCPLCNQNAI